METVSSSSLTIRAISFVDFDRVEAVPVTSPAAREFLGSWERYAKGSPGVRGPPRRRLREGTTDPPRTYGRVPGSDRQPACRIPAPGGRPHLRRSRARRESARRPSATGSARRASEGSRGRADVDDRLWAEAPQGTAARRRRCRAARRHGPRLERRSVKGLRIFHAAAPGRST